MNVLFTAKELGVSFRKNREALGLTLSDIADRTGYRRQTIGDLEAGGNVGLHVVMAALSALGKGLQVVDARVDYDAIVLDSAAN
ncbi:MAG: transcriptional regulator, family [Verrucomicrobiaceae bacterium]|nr:transcriptional regulator, family [Verrucomicrobiaceae bacterium]